MIGRTIGRYRILAKLGEGGMGSVWKAEDTLLGRTIALKFLPQTLATQPEARRRFLREAQAASVLDHPGIATVFDAGEADGLVYIALLYVEGETLSDVISRGPLPVDEAVRIARAAAEALGHAHSRGVLHRDITSRNIMVARDGRVVVVDFGLALPAGETRLTRTGTAMGTVAYMAPEVAQGGAADNRSDLYGLGVVLYEMLTGTLPFAGDRAEAILYSTVHQAPEPPSRRRAEIPAALDAIVQRALAKDPAERYPVAGALAADLASIQAMRARRPHIRTVLGLAVVALLLAALAFGLLERTSLLRRLLGPRFPSVAVLPLHIQGGEEQESAALAEGIGEVLATKLTQMHGLRVIPWITSQRYSDPSRRLQDIAKELDVSALLVGTFRRQGDQIQGTLSLVDGKTGMATWADEFEQPFSGLFDVQRQIAIGAATKLMGKLTGREEESLARPPARSVEAFEFYRRGAYALQAATEESTDVALDYFDKALHLDSTLAEAYVGIGAVHTSRFYNGLQGGATNLEQARRSYTSGLKFDPASCTARRGLLRVYWNADSEDCLKLGKEFARQAREDVEGLLVRAEAYFFGCLADKAVPLLTQALQLDPANQSALWELVIANAWSGRYKEGVEAGALYLSRFGDDPEVLEWMGAAHHAQGEFESAKTCYEKSLALFGDEPNDGILVMAGNLYSETGEHDRAQALFQRQLGILQRKLTAYPDNVRMRQDLACAYALLGDREGYLKAADQIPASTEWLWLPCARAAFGEPERGLEVLQQAVHSGRYDSATPILLRTLGGRTIMRLPGYESFLREWEANGDRLRALY